MTVFNFLVMTAFVVAAIVSLAPIYSGLFCLSACLLLILSRTARRAALWVLAAIAGLLALEWLEKRLKQAAKPGKIVIVRPPHEPRFRKPPRAYWPWPFDELRGKEGRDFDDDIPF